MKAIAIIPARMDSSRFPGKPMAKIHRMPMIGHCYHRTSICDDFRRKGFKREFRNCRQLINYDSASETDYFLRMQKNMEDKKFKPSFVIVR